ncbi:unnamed protein product [Withania somnifera]
MTTSGYGRRPLPEDLYGNILLRLPNPNFIKEHLNNCSNNKSPQLLIYDFYAPDGSTPLLVISDHSVRFRGLTNLIGSVDGLFLLERVSDDDTISLLALWNPATREVRVLPEPEVPFSTSYDDFGFGLDPSTNDYKVSWRIFTHKILKILRDSIVSFSYGSAYLNGAYYWAIREGDECNFLSYDFGNEVFGKIDGPRDDYSYKMPIIFDDSVALFNVHDYSHHDIWVMIQPGVWNKLFSFQCFPYFKSWYSSTVIAATRRSRLVSYNVKTQKMMCLGFHHPHLKINRYDCRVYTFKESLLIIMRENREVDHCNYMPLHLKLE